MNYDALKTFVTLAEVRHFTKTAQLLHISQPSVSLHIKNLEQEFETELFVRSSKLFKITPTGEVLYHRAKQIISIYEQTKQEIMEYHSHIKGLLKIGASFTIGEYILPELLYKMSEQYPQLTIEVTIGNTDEIAHAVHLLEVDIGLIEGHTNNKELTVSFFKEDELYIVAANNHPLTQLEHITIHDLQQQAWITREHGSGTREFFNHFIRTNGLVVSSLLTISSNQGIKESVIRGIGISLLSKSVISRDLASQALAIIPVSNLHFTRMLSYIYSPLHEHNRGLEAFLELIQQQAKHDMPPA